MARSLNCVEGPTPDPCGVCPSCVALAPEGPGSIDVVELDAASHGGVDDTRDLRDRAFYMPAESRYRVFIIDEAHMVSPQGFNALLKIVEEPPEHLVFIFATTEPEKVMATIRSRTHHYPFRLIPPATLRKLLERLCAEEQRAGRAGGVSAGHPGRRRLRARLAVDPRPAAGRRRPGGCHLPERGRDLLGVTDAALLDEAVDALAADDGASVFGAVDKVVEAGHDPRRFATDLLQRFRDLVILAAVPDAAEKGLLDVPQDQLTAMVGQAERLGAGTLTRMADILHTGLTEMRGTTAPRLALELMCARMLLPAGSDDAGALVQRVERLEKSVAGLGAGSVSGASRRAGLRSPPEKPHGEQVPPLRPGPAERAHRAASRTGSPVPLLRSPRIRRQPPSQRAPMAARRGDGGRVPLGDRARRRPVPHLPAHPPVRRSRFAGRTRPAYRVAPPNPELSPPAPTVADAWHRRRRGRLGAPAGATRRGRPRTGRRRLGRPPAVDGRRSTRAAGVDLRPPPRSVDATPAASTAASGPGGAASPATSARRHHSAASPTRSGGDPRGGRRGLEATST